MSHLLDLGSRKFWRLAGRVGGPRRAPAVAGRAGEPLAQGHRRTGGGRGGAARRRPSDRTTRRRPAPSMSALDGPGFDARPAAAGDPRLLRAHRGVADGGVDRLVAAVLARGGAGPRLSAGASSSSPCRCARSTWPAAWTAGSRRSLTTTDPGRRRLVCARCAGAGRTCSAAATRRVTLPGAARPSVHVAFPLESGNVQVFLRPSVSRRRRSRPGVAARPVRAGRHVRRGARRRPDYAARVPLHETSGVYVDSYGVLRTDHELRLWNASVSPALQAGATP